MLRAPGYPRDRVAISFPRPKPSETPQPASSSPPAIVAAPPRNISTSEGQRSANTMMMTIQQQQQQLNTSASISSDAPSGAIGLLRQRETGNSPTKQRQAFPLSTSMQDLTSTAAGAGRSVVLRKHNTATSLDSGAMGGYFASSTVMDLLPPREPTRQGEGTIKPLVTIVFDLDETLCSNRRPGKALLRPHVLEMLRHLRELGNDPAINCDVEIILWTASVECVARPVLERLDPQRDIFQHCIFRDRRWYRENIYHKDLRRLGRDINHCVIVENSPQSVRMNRKHSILVKDFFGTFTHDNELVVVQEVLDGWVRLCGTLPHDSEDSNIVSYLTHSKLIGSGNEVIVHHTFHLPAKPTAQPSSLLLGSTRSLTSPIARLHGVNPGLPLLTPLRRR